MLGRMLGEMLDGWKASIFGRKEVPMNTHVVEPVVQAHVMKIIDHTGHSLVTWNPDDPESVAAARQQFDRLTREGHSAFEMRPVMENGVIVEQKGDLVRRFDPQLGHILMVPQRQGG